MAVYVMASYRIFSCDSSFSTYVLKNEKDFSSNDRTFFNGFAGYDNNSYSINVNTFLET